MGWMEFMIQMCPTAFRKRYGQEMLQVFRESHRDVLQEEGKLAAFRHLVHSSADVLTVALKEHVQEASMLKARPKVLILLLSLWLITLYSVLQYGYWNALSMNENAGLLRVFNPRTTQTDVTLQPEYAALADAIEQHFPMATFRIMDNHTNYGAFGGQTRVLSVAVLDPSLDDQVLPGESRQFPLNFSSDLSKSAHVKLLKRQLALFQKDMAPILNALTFQDFDVQTVCITSHFKKMPTILSDDPSTNAMMGPMSMQHMKAELWLEKNPQNPHLRSLMTPHHVEQLDLISFQQRHISELAYCNQVPTLDGRDQKSIQPEPFTKPVILY